MPATSSVQFETDRFERSHPLRPPARLSAVVGLDGSDPSLAALDTAIKLTDEHNGHLEVVYVAHVPSVSLSAEALVGYRAGFDEISKELRDTVRARLTGYDLDWHFQRRDGAVAEQLIVAAAELSYRQGSGDVIMIVVGSAEHLVHHVLRSVAATLTHEGRFPLLMVPTTTHAQRESQPQPAVTADDVREIRGAV